MKDPLIYIAVVDGKVSHIYSDQPLRFQVVAWESERKPTIRIDPEIRTSTEKDSLVKELAHLVTQRPYDDTILHGGDR